MWYHHLRGSDPLPATEQEMVGLLVSHCRNLFESSCPVATEVRSHGRARADVVLVVHGELVAIEVKRTGWRRGLVQALLNQSCVDRSYLAVWNQRVSPTLLDHAYKLEVGVLAITSDSLEIVVEAPVSAPSPSVRARIMRAVLAASS